MCTHLIVHIYMYIYMYIYMCVHIRIHAFGSAYEVCVVYCQFLFSCFCVFAAVNAVTDR